MKKILLFMAFCWALHAAVLCEESTGISDDELRFYDFVVEGPAEPAVGDTITVEFTLRNVGKETVALGSKGVHGAVESEGGVKRFGYTARDEWLSELEEVDFSGAATLEEAGEWSAWPSYQLKNGSYGPDGWAGCSFEVGERPAGVPDLRIIDVWGYGDVPGVYTEIRYMIRNAGNGTSGPSATRIYLDGVHIRDDYIAGLGPGETRVESFPYEGECTGASDTFSASADWEGDVEESDEENNEYSREYSCPEILKPDLLAENLTVYGWIPCELFDYSQGGIRFSVRNAGGGRSPELSARVYIDGNWTGSVAIPALAAGESFGATYRRLGLCSGREDRIRVVVDMEGRVTESNESNNEAQVAFGCAWAPSLPVDLRVRNITLLDGANGTKIVRYSIENAGRDYVCTSESGLYADGVLIATMDPGRLSPSHTKSGEFGVPYMWEEMCNGTSSVISVAADHNNAINESNETNNAYLVEVQCPLRPDLVPGMIFYYPPGTVSWRVVNNGSAPSPQTRARATISGNGVYRELMWDVPALEPSQDTFLRHNITLGTALGRVAYSATVDADYGNLVDEGAKEGNNWNNYSLIVEPWCENKVRDGDEEDTDCGGTCTPCDVCGAGVLPEKFDWRNWKGKNWVSIAKNQRNCGSCWAFAAIGAMEAAFLQENNGSSMLERDFSEQMLVSCSEAGSCLGGGRLPALDFLKANGTVEEWCFQYASANCLTVDSEGNKICRESCNCTSGLGGCRGACGCNYCQNAQFWKISGYGEVRGPAGMDEIKRNIACHGPLLAASASWGHAFLLVGWDNNNGSWIIKNSWGQGWGENGFGRVPYTGHNYSDLAERNMYYAEGVYNE